MPTSSSQGRTVDAQAHAARIDIAAANTPRTGDTTASPMSLASPVTQGFKRTADGSVKGIGLGIDTPSKPIAAHKRNKSMDTHSATRIGEVRNTRATVCRFADVLAAFRTAKDAPILRNGQGPEWVGEAIA